MTKTPDDNRDPLPFPDTKDMTAQGFQGDGQKGRQPDASTSITGRERYAIYTGRSSPSFAPILAGITYPDPSYEISRSRSDCYVFEYVIRGSGHVLLKDRQYLMEQGDAYILHMGESHHYFSDRNDPWEKVWFNVSGILVRHLLSDYGLDSVVKIPAFGEGRHLTAIFDAIRREPVHCTNELALLLLGHIQALSDFMEGQTVSHSQALAMKNFIEQNLTRPLSIDDIAAHVHLSRSRAVHLYRESYGTTPYHYYLNQKLELAQTLLKRTTLSIQEIAEQLGFSDYHHFSGFFKKRCGVSPSYYRR